MSKFAGNNLIIISKRLYSLSKQNWGKRSRPPLSHLWNAFTHNRRENTGAPAFQLPKHFFGVLDKSFLPLSCLLTKSTDAKMQRKRRWTLISCRCWIEAQWCDTVTTTYHLCVREREKSVFAVLHFSFVRGWVWNQKCSFPMNNIWAWNLNTFWVLSSCSIGTQRLKYQSRKSAYQAFPAALQHILIAIHNILQKVVLCHSYVVPHCSETLAFNTKLYKIMLKRGKK